jgi:hypothetical protein
MNRRSRCPKEGPTLTHLRAVLCFAVVATLVVPAAGQIPDEFELYQNTPNPFCNVSGEEVTTFLFFCPEEAFVMLEVLSPDTTSVLAVLVCDTTAAGYHSVIWDGTDDVATTLPQNDYPYVMTAYVGRPPVFDFADTLTATIECMVPVDETTWGAVKAGYHEVEPGRM